MKLARLFGPLLAVLLLVPGAARAQPANAQLAPRQTAELRAFSAAIRQLYDLKERDFAAGRDDHILGRFYAADAISISPEDGTQIGTARLKPLYDRVVKESTVRIVSVHPYVNGNAGWDWANFYVTPRDPRTRPFGFAILFLWAKEHGRWVCKGDAYINGEFPGEK